MAVAAMAGAAISGGSNMISSLGSAGIQSATALESNKQNIDFQNSVISRGEQAFEDIGLPKASFWSGSQFQQPNTMFHLGGSNFYEGSGVNANLPTFTTSPYPQYNHSGKPSTLSSANRNLGPRGNFGDESRPGLGFNSQQQTTPKSLDYSGFVRGETQYNAVPPGNTYNTVGINTDRNWPSNQKSTQTSINNSNFYKSVGVNTGFNTTSTGMQTAYNMGNTNFGSGASLRSANWRFK